MEAPNTSEGVVSDGPTDAQATATPSRKETTSVEKGHTHPDDVFIAIMGGTGVGKSTFISKLVGDQPVIGHGQSSCMIFSDSN